MDVTLTTTDIAVPDFERVCLVRETRLGYEAVFAIHDTTLGPAVGGTRVREYGAVEEAVADALRLARGMTYKNALAGLPFGGGKTVILGPAPTEPALRHAFFGAHGAAIARFEGRFITGEDVGTTPADMESVAAATDHVGGRESGMGDPSPYTALGVLYALEAAAHDSWGHPSLEGRTVALQGVGAVGLHLARLLRDRGAHVVVADVADARLAAAHRIEGVRAVAPDRIFDAAADVFAPCALGGVLDRSTVERLPARIVCGAANNQLAEPGLDARLRQRGIRYVPDYVANAGGVISGAVDLAGWDRARMEEALRRISSTVRDVFALADVTETGTQSAADRLAEQRLGGGADPRGADRAQCPV